jgi:hypothetical protein
MVVVRSRRFIIHITDSGPEPCKYKRPVPIYPKINVPFGSD